MVGGGWDRKNPSLGNRRWRPAELLAIVSDGTCFFIDLEQLVLDYKQLKASNFTTNYSLDETLLERFENADQALRNVLPHVHHSHSVAAILSEIAHNLQRMYWDCIRHGDFPCRSICS